MKTTRAEFDPQGWDEFVGQPVIKDRLDIAVQSALRDQRRLDHVLLDGPAGAGKSTMAGLLAEAMGEPLVTFSEALTVRKLRNTLFEHENGAVILLDELHCYPAPTKNALLPLLESGWFDGVCFPFCTIVAATTEPEKLAAPLIDRFIHCCYADYTKAEMVRITQRLADCAGVTLSKATVEKLAVAAGGVPRVARGFVIAARDLAGAGRTVDVKTILAFCRREHDGLSTDHLDYLRVVNENRGVAGLEQICSRLRKHRSIVQSLERLLQDRKYIFLASDGRTITQAGRQRIQEPGKLRVVA